MDADRCPACARPFTSGEVTGLGFLRSRPEAAGGPYMEFACPGCERIMRLIPHGDGRYAPPGAPPPPAAPPELRRPPWMATGRGPRQETASSPPPTGTPPREAGGEPHRAPPERPPSRRAAARPGPTPTPDVLARLLLGVPSDADGEALDRAYRERSRTCHPDKVAHLDPEFQMLAERKFRELTAAYELLRLGPGR